MSALRLDGASAALRRRLGPVAWVVLEELLLQAGPGGEVETNVRALAGILSLDKDTVARSVRRLRAEGLVVVDTRRGAGGRFGARRYRTRAVPGLVPLDPPPVPPPPRSRHQPVPRAGNGTQLSLIADTPRPEDDHRRTARTTQWKVDALAPGVRPRHAPGTRDAGDGGVAPC